MEENKGKKKKKKKKFLKIQIMMKKIKLII